MPQLEKMYDVAHRHAEITSTALIIAGMPESHAEADFAGCIVLLVTVLSENSALHRRVPAVFYFRDFKTHLNCQA